MPRRKPIWIVCPQHAKRVRGWYEAGPDGAFRFGPGETYLLESVRCSQDGGRCMQTLCVLHRYNRRGPESWYPEKVLAMPEPKHRASGHGPASQSTRRRGQARNGDADLA